MKRSLWAAVSIASAGGALIRAAEPPVLTLHPLPQRIAAGHRVELAAEAQFDPALTWHWLKDGVPLTDSNNNRLTLRNMRAGDSGIYRAVARNNDGETWSRAVAISVLHRGAEPGAVDSEFADRFINGTDVHAVLPSPDGSVVIAGNFTGVGARAIGRVARLLPDGTLDADFNAAGFGADGTVRTLAAGDDGTLFIGGSFSTYNGQPAKGLAQLHADGSLDGSFAPEIDPHVTEVRSLARQSDGRLLVAGTSVDGATTSHWMVRLSTDGPRDPTFVSPSFLNGRVNAIALQPDGRICVAGTFRQMPPGASGQFNRIARLLADGIIDFSFSPPGGTSAGANNEVRTIGLHTDGRIVVGGRFTSINGTARFGLARLSPTGTLDSGFNPTPDDFVHSLIIEDSGSLIVGGAFTRIGGATIRSLARLRPDGSVLETLTPPAFDNDVSVITAAPSGRLFVAGLFSQPHQFVVRLHLAPPLYSAPTVVLAPAPATCTSTTRGNLLAAFDGHPTPAIEWFRDGALVNGASGPEIAVSIPGRYHARAMNSLGSTESPPATVTLVRPSPGARPARSFSASGAPQSMPDAGVLNLPLSVTGPGSVNEVRVMIDLEHPDASQITAELISPLGTAISLANRPGRRGANFQKTVFAAGAVTPVSGGVAPFIGTFAPSGPLQSFAGQSAAGTWTLRLTDAREDFLMGTVRAWSLDLFLPAAEPSYQSWAAIHFPGLPPGSNPQDDPNHDGFINLLAYAFTQPPELVPVAHWDRTSSTLRHRQWVGAIDVGFAYEFSTRLSGWESAVPVVAFRRRFDDQTEDVMLQFPMLPPAGACYFRVRAQ